MPEKPRYSAPVLRTPSLSEPGQKTFRTLILKGKLLGLCTLKKFAVLRLNTLTTKAILLLHCGICCSGILQISGELRTETPYIIKYLHEEKKLWIYLEKKKSATELNYTVHTVGDCVLFNSSPNTTRLAVRPELYSACSVLNACTL